MDPKAKDDLRDEERRVAGEIPLTPALIPVLVFAILLIMSLFLPHSGPVLGLDVLLDTDVAQVNSTKAPERIYSVLALVSALLAFATLLSRSAVVALFGWGFACVTTVYSMFAGWMRQTRPLTITGEGISYGLVLGMIAAFGLAVSFSLLVFRRTTRQAAIALARREHVHSDPVLRAQQQYLRSGLTPNTQTNLEVVDDRRARARRRHAASKNTNSSSAADSTEN
ncbi:hypothetical protein KRX51_05015 [Corynebacterium sp. TAE3-ERU12]|nr:hypothetical protein [Corynebacterium sp. TAE3-ERU12]